MFRAFLKLFSTPAQPEKIAETGPDVTIYARIPQPPLKPSGSTAQPFDHPSDKIASQRPSFPTSNVAVGAEQKAQHPIPNLSPSTHRQRVLSMRLEHTRICSPKRAERLAKLGVETAGDLAITNPKQIANAFGAPQKAARILNQYRRAIRFSASVPDMMPRDAMLLVSVHRRSVRGLARETPVVLQRDLERFAESSQGQSHLRGRRLPSIKRIKQWIRHCESLQLHGPIHARVA